MIGRALTIAAAAFLLAHLPPVRRELSRRIRPGYVGRGNCMNAYWKFREDGGVLIVSHSESHPGIPHTMWAEHLPEIEVLSFEPLDRRYGIKAFTHSPFFRGQWHRKTFKA